MANELNITQFKGLDLLPHGALAQAPVMPAAASSSEDLGAAAEITLDDECNIVGLTCSALFYVNFGTAAAVTAATIESTKVPANAVVYYRVKPGIRMSHYDGVT